MLTLAATVALAVIAAAWAAMNRRTRRPVLPYRHVAGTAIVAVLGWEVIANLPGAMLGYLALTAGREAAPADLVETPEVVAARDRVPVR